MKRSLLILPLLTLALASCSGTRDLAKTLSGDWRVTRLDGQAVPAEDNAPFLGFDVKGHRLYGFTGCNRLTGTLDAKAFVRGKADFSRLGMTRMLCHDDKYEIPFTQALTKATTSVVGQDEIQLKDSTGRTVIVLQKK